MDNIKLCPACQHQNPLAATVCEQCATPLVALLPSRTTIPVPESLLDSIPQLTDNQKPARRYDDALVFYVVGQSQPVILDAEIKKVMFGRLSPGESSPTIDLTPFDAHLFGVSRQHAMLFRSENGCFLQDLESTNGTWLNDKKLTPHKLYEVKSGDLIRLGQLGVRAYFETASTTYTLTMMDEVSTGQRLTPAYLETRLSPYLVALANAQQLIDAMMERPMSLVTIQSVTVEEGGRIAVVLSGARDILRLVEGRLSEWRSARMILVERLRALNDQVKAEGSADAKSDVKTQSEPLRKEIRIQLAEFARQSADQLAPQLSEALRQTYADKLSAPLQALFFSPIQPVAPSEPEATTEAEDAEPEGESPITKSE